MSGAPSNVLVIAPHPDDETLGCGGALLKWKASGARIHWLVVTGIEGVPGFSEERVRSRAREIITVAGLFGFDSYHTCNFPAAQLDTLPKGDIIGAIGQVIKKLQPDTVLVPYRNDVHSDHAAVFDAAVSATKTFRSPFVRALYAYETPSETDFGVRPDDPGFRPNLFVSIEAYLDQKLAIMSEYAGEMGAFPFPRSEECLRALATLRGSQANCRAAEGFMILKEIR
jgi:LmbE family N-acetylglucosaminyl deacetylase